MEEELDKRQIGKVYVVGIALDYCVFYSAMDSQKLGKDFFRYGCKNLPDRACVRNLDLLVQSVL